MVVNAILNPVLNPVANSAVKPIVNPGILKRTLDQILGSGATFAEVFVEDTYSSKLEVMGQKAQQAIVGELHGAGLRAFYGSEVHHVTTNDLSESGLFKAANQLIQIKSGNGLNSVKDWALQNPNFDHLHVYGTKPWEMDRETKLKWLYAVDEFARAVSSEISQVQVLLLEKFQRVQVANSLGVLCYDERPYTRVFVTAYATYMGNTESFYSNEGGFVSSQFVETLDLRKLGETAAKGALRVVRAPFAPAGEMPVVIGNNFGGVIFHEACGHGLETTSVARGTSVFTNKLGEQIANPVVTAIDEGWVGEQWGNLKFDDEGRATEKTVLIENGILKSYLVDEWGALKTGYRPTGSGRRQSYKFAPTSRMRNTYIAPGKDSFEEMIRDVDYGLYAQTLGGGSVSPGSGEYNFAVAEGYIIRNGRIEELVKGASLIGKGIETLGRITKVSSEFKANPGMCGSTSGTVPVTVGQPHILVASLVVGGRA